MALPCKQEPIEGVDFYKSKVTLSRKEREDEKNSIIRKVLEQIDVKPTPIKSVDELRKQYPEETAPEKGYDGLFLIESGTDEGYLYFFDNGTKKWTRSIIYEDSPAVEELKTGKVNKDMVDWGTMPETITDKKTFYKEVSNVFATADHSIYMFGTPEELQRVWDIWGKPEGLKATHVYIAIRPISNKSSRHAFIMWAFSSNYANPYFRVISGYAGSYVSANDKGWVSVNLINGNQKVLATNSLGEKIELPYDVLPTKETLALRQSDGTIQAAEPKEDTDVATKNYVDSNKTDVYDLSAMFHDNGKIEPTPLNPIGSTIIVDINEENTGMEAHLDKQFLDRLFIVTPLTVTRYDNKKHKVILDDAEVQLMKGLQLTIELEYQGILMKQTQIIWFSDAPSSAVIDLGTPLPDPTLFSATIIPQYNHNVSELTLQTTGSAIPTIMKIIDVKGIL